MPWILPIGSDTRACLCELIQERRLEMGKEGYVELKNAKEMQMDGDEEDGRRSSRINTRTSRLPFTLPAKLDSEGEQDEKRTVRDQVQFGAPYFFATEDEAKAVIDVMRIGHDLHKACSVRYETENGSALAGDKYTAVEGVCDFLPGEVHKSFEVPVTEDDNFDTTLEFGVRLSDPQNCELGMYLSKARVLIIDNDVFPSNDLTDAVRDGSTEALQDVGVQLLIAYMQFTYNRVPGIRWKTMTVLAMDQLHNLYYFMQIELRIYLVDVVLNLHGENTASELIIENDRLATAIILGVIYFTPFLLLMLLGYIKTGPLDMGCDIRKHLRVNLFRKYLNYSEESLEEVHLSDISASMKSEIPDIANNGYLMLFDVAQGTGKIVVVGLILLLQDWTNLIPLLLFPLLMLGWLLCRQSRQVKLASHNSQSESSNQELLVRTVIGSHLIRDYKQKSFVVQRYEKEIGNHRAKAIAYITFNWGNEQLIPLISCAAIALYIPFGSSQVIKGATSLGAFLATINVYKDLGERFQNVYENLHAGLTTIDPLISLTKMLNKPTDLGERMHRNTARRDFLKEALDHAERETENNEMFVSGKYSSTGQSHDRSFFDKLPVALDKIQIGHVSALHRVSARVAQGNIVLICGPHSSGKGTLVHLLTDNRTPRSGTVLCPSYLRCLHVAYQPDMITYMNLFENLVFGVENPDVERVKRIFDRVVLGKEHESGGWLSKKFDNDLEEFLREKDEPDLSYQEQQEQRTAKQSENRRPSVLELKAMSMPWHKLMSNNERKRVHFARAMVYNPEVMVLHSPVDEVDHQFSDEVLGLLREFVDKRGLELPEEEFGKRRPRTVFFTGGEVKKEELMSKSDIMWHLGPRGLVVQHKGYKSFTRGNF